MDQPLYAIGKQSNGDVQDVRRLDVVWDRYITDSMRQGLRERRGQGDRRRAMSGSTIPGNWQIFLLTDENKTELCLCRASGNPGIARERNSDHL